MDLLGGNGSRKNLRGGSDSSARPNSTSRKRGDGEKKKKSKKYAACRKKKTISRRQWGSEKEEGLGKGGRPDRHLEFILAT